MDRERRRARTGLEQLALRGQRRVRSRDAARPRRPDRPGSPAARTPRARDRRRTLRASCSTAPRTPKPRSSSSASGSAGCATRSGASRARRHRMPRHLLALAERSRPPGRVDHRRRRLGLRHRLRRRRPGPVVGTQRQHPRPRHRGLLEHRRSVIEGDAARRGGQVRGGRQGHGQEGSRRDRPVIRQRLRRPGLDGRERSADHQGVARGGCLAGAVAGHRLQHLHRPRDRHVEVDDPPEGRGQERLLAALSLPPLRDRRWQAVQARLARRHRSRSPTSSRPRRASPSSSGRIRSEPPSSRRWPRPTPTSAGATTSSWPASNGRCRMSIARPRRSCPRSRATRAIGTKAKETGHDRRPAAPATSVSSCARRSSPRPRRTTRIRSWRGASRRAGVGAIVLPSLFEEEILAEEIGLARSLEQGTEVFAEALDYFPRVQTFAGAADRYLAALERVKASVAIPIIASLNASSVGGWVTYARRIQDAGADALELNLYHVAADPRRSAADMEARDLELIAAVRASITIPLAVKLSPFYSAFANFAAAAADAGADGLVLFNRFYQPDLDLDVDRGRPAARAEPAVGDAAACPLDRDPAAAARPGPVARGDLGRPLRRRRRKGPAGRRRRRDDDVGPAPPRTRARRLGRSASSGNGWPSTTTRPSQSCGAVRARRRSSDPSAFERANYMATLHSWAAT